VRTALKEPRAVTAAEAPFIEPAKESTKETMMPWKGWVGRFVKDQFGDERYKAFREFFFYKPDDRHDLYQIPLPSTKVPINKEGTMFAQFRYPSPGSQDPVRIPDIDPARDPYDVAHYKRDTARRYEDAYQGIDDINVERIKLALMDPNDPDVKELQEALDNPESSPGNQGHFATGPTDFDPSGLRATMSANHKALNESLDENEPDHLPYPDWYYNVEDTQKELEWYEERDLPLPMGCTGYGTVPTHDRVAKW